MFICVNGVFAVGSRAANLHTMIRLRLTLAWSQFECNEIRVWRQSVQQEIHILSKLQIYRLKLGQVNLIQSRWLQTNIPVLNLVLSTELINDITGQVQNRCTNSGWKQALPFK